MMEEPLKDVWGQVGEGFTSLGRAMQDRYRHEDEERPSSTADADRAADALREAFERFVAAGRDVGQRTVDVFTDDDVRSQGKRAAASLSDALAATVDLIGRELSGVFRRQADPSGEAEADPAVVGVPPETPDAVRPSATGLVAGPLDTETDITVADERVEPGERTDG